MRASVDAIADRLRTVSAADVAQRLADPLVGSRPAGARSRRWRRPARSRSSIGDSVRRRPAHLQHVVRDDGDEVVV